MNLVNSQETRRMYDRIIGFKLSSLLQKKMSSKSAGRVQSVTLKMICDNDQEIKDFKPEEYWTIDAVVSLQWQRGQSLARQSGWQNREDRIMKRKPRPF
jgi:DNA topoisomerase IA